jgi:hypothetical protein
LANGGFSLVTVAEGKTIKRAAIPIKNIIPLLNKCFLEAGIIIIGPDFSLN